MRPLHPIDFIFLSLEKRQQPMHVGGLFLFEIPENASSTFVHDLVQDIRQSKSIPVPPFNNQLNGLFWGEDEEFDIDHDHFFNEITSEDIKQQLFDNTNMAVERGSFGVPTFFVNDQIFFGKDKLVEIEEYLLTLK